MVRIVTSDFEPEVTKEMLNGCVLAVFDGLSGSLKEKIDDHMRNPIFRNEREGLVDCEGELSLEINGTMVSLVDPQFTSLVLRTMPRSP